MFVKRTNPNVLMRGVTIASLKTEVRVEFYHEIIFKRLTLTDRRNANSVFTNMTELKFYTFINTIKLSTPVHNI